VVIEKIQTNQSLIRYFYYFFPPLWFTDFYETFIGNTDLPFHGLYLYALLGAGLVAAAFFMTTGLSYGRYLKKVGNTARQKRISSERIKLFLTSLFNHIFLRNPVQRAVFHFYRKTIKTSMLHKMRLASFVAIGVGLIPFQVAVKDIVPKSLIGINKSILFIPLILSFFLLLGIRATMNIPVSLRANWIFRLTEWTTRKHYFSGMRKAVFFLQLLPLFVLIFVFYLFLWGGITAFYHSLYGLAVSGLVMEFLFLTSAKIPFTCSYLPGKERIQLYWLPYILLFLAYINLMSWIELQLLRVPLYFFLFYAIVVFIILCIRMYQWLLFYKKTGLQFEEQLEPVMVSLDYKTPSYKRRIS